MKKLTEWGTAALLNFFKGSPDKDENPFETEGGRTYMRFDSIELKIGETDIYGRPAAKITFKRRGVRLYEQSLSPIGPNDSVTVYGFDGRMEVTAY